MSGYIGNIPVPQATQTRDTFTATSGQTSFATSGYTPGFLDVYLNGVHLVNGTDYTASNGSDVVLTTGATTGDNLEVVAYTTFQVVDQSFIGNFSVDSPTFVVDAANNRVGIGTSSPQGSLNVVKGTASGTTASTSANNIVIDGTSGTETGITLFSTVASTIRFGDASASGVGTIEYGHSTDYMRFVTAGAERLRITSTGSVGIGTSSPATLLDVRDGVGSILTLGNTGTFVGGESSYLKFREASTQLAEIGWEADTNELRINNRISAFTSFYTANTERARIDASGNLLVGKTDTSINTQGVLFNPNFSHMSSTNDVPLALNRKLVIIVYGQACLLLLPLSANLVVIMQQEALAQSNARGDKTWHLQRRTADDKIEIVGDYKHIQIRQATIIERDGVEISRNFHRRVVGPLDDVSGETAEVQAIAALVHTAEVKAAYAAHLDAQQLGGGA
jgi:hypothetical protein